MTVPIPPVVDFLPDFLPVFLVSLYFLWIIQAQVKYQRFREAEIKDAFEGYCKERMRDLFSRAGPNNTWMPDSVKKDMLAYKDSPAFKRRSAQCSKNRASKGKNGKAPGTHTMGRLNSIQFMDKLCNDSGGLKLPSPIELMKKSKQRKSGGYVNDEVSEILETFQKNKDALLETIDEEEIDDHEIYIDTVKGFNKKGEVVGLGKATSFYYEKPLPSATPKSGTSYTPGFASKLSAELNSIRKWKLELEKTLASKGIHITPESCNPNSLPNSRADDDEGNGGSGSDFATQLLSS